MTDPSFLLIFDDAPATDELINYFAQFNIKVILQHKLQLINNESGMPAAILIHWSLLKNELQIIHKFYTTYPVPLLIINDEEDEKSCIAALEAGADDFIIKPLYARELHARISAINRRVIRAQQQPEHGKEIFAFANWRLYPSSRQVFDNDNKELFLSAGEYDLLLTFIQQSQRVLDRELLLHVTKNTDLNPFDRRIDVQISRLRQKIEIDAKKPVLIKTIRNGGYLFTAQVIALKEGED